MGNNFVEFNVGREPKKKLYAYLDGTGVTHVTLIKNPHPQGKDFLVLGVPADGWWHATRAFAERLEDDPYIRLLLPLDEHGRCTADAYADLMGRLTPEQVWDEGGDVELGRLFEYTVGYSRRMPAVKNRYSTTISAAMPSWARDIRQDKVFYKRVFIRIGHIPWDDDQLYWVGGFVAPFGRELGFISPLFKFGKKSDRYTEGTLGAHMFLELCRIGFASHGLPEEYRANPEFYMFCHEQKELLGAYNPYNPRHVKAHHLYKIFDRKVSPEIFGRCYEFYAYALKTLHEDYLRFPSEENPLGERFAKLNNDYKVFILKELMSADAEQELYIRDIVNQGLEGSYSDYADLVRAVLA